MTSIVDDNDSSPARIERFLDGFFGPGNAVWPDRDPHSNVGRNLDPHLRLLREGSPAPVVLPRKVPGADASDAYVIASDPAHATITSEMIRAFVGTAYSEFDGSRAHLNRADPVEAAILEFVGPNTTFVVRSGPQRREQADMWTALRLMCQVAAARPARLWHTVKPLGVLLAEFEAALASGENAASADLLDQLAAGTGLSGPNLAHLQIKRLFRLGRSRELLDLANLSDVVAARPPQPVREAILAAVYDTVLVQPLDALDLSTARDKLVEHGRLVPALLADDHSHDGTAALSVVVLAAIIRNDLPLLRHALSVGAAADLPAILLEAAYAASNAEPTSDDEAARPSEVAQVAPPRWATTADDAVAALPIVDSWPALIGAASRNPSQITNLLAQETWTTWLQPAESDREIADILEVLDNAQSQNVWAAVGAFVDADDYASPASRSAWAFLRNALTYSRFGPGDLAAVVALVEIILRGAPAEREYAALIDDLGSEHSRWVSADRATVVLDLLDLLCRSACPNEATRAVFTEAVLSLLQAHHVRLAPDQRAFAKQLAGELHSATDWAESASVAPVDEAISNTSETILLYSLDESVLARTADALARIAPGVRLHLSSDRVGTAQLRQWARGAGVIVLATRCAQHAATGFIRSHARATAVVREANGSGSASLIRATIEGLGEVPPR